MTIILKISVIYDLIHVIVKWKARLKTLNFFKIKLFHMCFSKNLLFISHLILWISRTLFLYILRLHFYWNVCILGLIFFTGMYKSDFWLYMKSNIRVWMKWAKRWSKKWLNELILLSPSKSLERTTKTMN